MGRLMLFFKKQLLIVCTLKNPGKGKREIIGPILWQGEASINSLKILKTICDKIYF